jgi:hypothetical protein
METASRALWRLIGALETLVDREAFQIASGDHAGFLATQQKVAPVIAKLAQMGGGSADAEARAQVAKLLAKRRNSQEHLAARIKHLREELARTGAGLRRLSQIAPLYIGRATRIQPRRLSFVG